MTQTVLHASQPTEAGVGRYVLDLVRDQVARGLQVTVACPVSGPLSEGVLAAGAAHLPWTAERAPGPGVFPEALGLGRLAGRLDPDVVHLHSSKAGLAGRLAVRGRRPTVFQPHAWSFHAVGGLAHRGALAWERFGARWTDVVVCVSEAERRAGEAAGISADWRVIANGVDVEALRQATSEDRRSARKRLGLDGAGRVVVCVGRLSRQKGQDVLLGAWPTVRERVPGARLVLVGDGPDEEALRPRAGEGVELVGQRGDVPDWLAAADVVAFPSRWEGMSIALLEAMARGRSVVATDVAGAAEALGSDAGALVPAERPDALAEALVERLLDPSKAAAEGKAARARAERNHALPRVGEAIAALYGEVIAARRTRASSSRRRSTL